MIFIVDVLTQTKVFEEKSRESLRYHKRWLVHSVYDLYMVSININSFIKERRYKYRPIDMGFRLPLYSISSTRIYSTQIATVQQLNNNYQKVITHKYLIFLHIKHCCKSSSSTFCFSAIIFRQVFLV